MRVYKYVIMPIETMVVVGKLTMPDAAKPLSVGWQDGVGVVMWALVHPAHVEREYAFEFLPTGGEGPNWADFHETFVGTVQMPNGLVGHLFVDYS